MIDAVDENNAVEYSLPEVMNRISKASRVFTLKSVRFVGCEFSYDKAKPDQIEETVRIGIHGQQVQQTPELLTAQFFFQFSAPSPFPEDDDRKVFISTLICIDYSKAESEEEVAFDDARLFGLVNGVYNAWPYLREYVRSSLGRLGLPPFDLPLLHPETAARYAGVVKNISDNAEDEINEEDDASK
jgi:hypothetical protein